MMMIVYVHVHVVDVNVVQQYPIRVFEIPTDYLAVLQHGFYLSTLNLL